MNYTFCDTVAFLFMSGNGICILIEVISILNLLPSSFAIQLNFRSVLIIFLILLLIFINI